jgi:hypothetical protein
MMNFVLDFKNKFTKTPSMFAAKSFDALNYGIYIYSNKKDGVNITDLFKVPFSGVAGSFSFDEKMNIKTQMSLYQIKNGQFILLNK